MPADPTDRELDDDAIDLPPLPAVGDAEEVGTGDPEVEADLLGLGGPEKIGLDDAEGVDDFDPTSFLDLREEDGASLLDDDVGGDEVSPLYGQLDLGGEGEYGWSDDAPADAALFEDDEALVDLPEAIGGDDGEALGADDEALLRFEGDDALVGLPPLVVDGDDGGEDTAEDLDLEGDGEIAFFASEEATATASELPPPVDRDARVLAQGAVHALAVGAEGLWVVGDDLRRVVAGQVTVAPARGLEPEELVSIAVQPGPGVLVVGTRLGGAFRSVDGGATFAAINGWRGGREPAVACEVAFDGAGRLWLWAGGALHRSDDCGGSWTGPVLPRPVVDAVVDEGQLVVLVDAGDHRLEVLRCRGDGGAFEAVAPPCRQSEGPSRLAAGRGRVAVFAEEDLQGPAVFDGDAWRRTPELAGAHLGIFVDGVLHGAIHQPQPDRGAVIREGATVADLTTLFGETPPRLRVVGADQRIRAFAVSDARVFVACGRGLVSFRR